MFMCLNVCLSLVVVEVGHATCINVCDECSMMVMCCLEILQEHFVDLIRLPIIMKRIFQQSVQVFSTAALELQPSEKRGLIAAHARFGVAVPCAVTAGCQRLRLSLCVARRPGPGGPGGMMRLHTWICSHRCWNFLLNECIDAASNGCTFYKYVTLLDSTQKERVGTLQQPPRGDCEGNSAMAVPTVPHASWQCHSTDVAGSGQALTLSCSGCETITDGYWYSTPDAVQCLQCTHPMQAEAASWPCRAQYVQPMH